MKNYKIAVAGTGYVGLSLGVLFAQHHQVVAVDIVQAKVDMINNKKSPIQDDYIEVLQKTFYPVGIQFAVVEDDFCSTDRTADEVEQYFKEKAMRAILNQKEFDEELVHELIKKIYVGIDNSVEIEFKCSDPYQEVLAFVAEVQNE